MSRRPPATPSTCPCTSGLAYGACCGRWHHGATRLGAPDALALMRSRYCAYALGLLDYLLDTWHLRTRPAQLDADPPGWRWLGLTVTSHEASDRDHATVEFVARGKQGGRAQRLHERSRFVREDGRWYYIDAVG